MKSNITQGLTKTTRLQVRLFYATIILGVAAQMVKHASVQAGNLFFSCNAIIAVIVLLYFGWVKREVGFGSRRGNNYTFTELWAQLLSTIAAILWIVVWYMAVNSS